MQTAKKYIAFLIALSAVMLTTGIACNFILDPFQIYHGSYFVKDRYLWNQRYQNAGIINRLWVEKNCCDTVLLGTSMSENFRPDFVAKILRIKGALNLSVSGALPEEMIAILDDLVRKKKPTTVIMDINLNPSQSFPARRIVQINDKNLIARKANHFFPIFLYNRNLIDDFKYLTSSGLYDLTDRLRRKGKPYNDLQAWPKQVLAGFNHADTVFKSNPVISRKVFIPGDDHFPNIDDLLVPTIAKNPDVDFVLFIPPFSHHYYASLTVKQYNRLLTMRKHLVSALSSYRNVRLFAFDTIYPETFDLNNYKDMAHYSPAVSEKIIRSIAKNEGLLTVRNIVNDIAEMTAQVNDYVERNRNRPKK